MGAIAKQYEEMYAVDVRLVGPFVQAVTSVLKTQCATTVQKRPPEFSGEESHETSHVGITLCIANETTLANVVMRFPREVYLGLISRMLGGNYKELNNDAEDAGKELANMIFNEAKRGLSEKKLAATKSIPMVLTSETAVRFAYLTSGKSIRQRFDSDLGTFSIDITTQSVSVSDKI